MNNSDIYNFNSISKSSTIQGDLEFSNPTNIFGKLKGNLTINSDDQTVVYIDASIEGDIHCHDIEIQGRVDGRIFSRGTVIIKSSAIVNGHLESKKLVVYPGSELNIEAHCE